MGNETQQKKKLRRNQQIEGTKKKGGEKSGKIKKTILVIERKKTKKTGRRKSRQTANKPTHLIQAQVGERLARRDGGAGQQEQRGQGVDVSHRLQDLPRDAQESQAKNEVRWQVGRETPDEVLLANRMYHTPRHKEQAWWGGGREGEGKQRAV